MRTFFFSFVFVCLFVCLFFFFAFHFWKRRKFVVGLPTWEFSTGNKYFTPGKNQENDFAPSEKYACYAPGAPLIKKRLSKVQKIGARNAREPCDVGSREKAPGRGPGGGAPGSPCVFQCRNSIFNTNLKNHKIVKFKTLQTKIRQYNSNYRYIILRLYFNTQIAFDRVWEKLFGLSPTSALRRLRNLWFVIMMCGLDPPPGPPQNSNPFSGKKDPSLLSEFARFAHTNTHFPKFSPWFCTKFFLQIWPMFRDFLGVKMGPMFTVFCV